VLLVLLSFFPPLQTTTYSHDYQRQLDEPLYESGVTPFLTDAKPARAGLRTEDQSALARSKHHIISSSLKRKSSKPIIVIENVTKPIKTAILR